MPLTAVILAGGRGTRMRPFTDSEPKGMFPIGGRPFLEHLVRLLRGRGITRVLMLLGYRADVIVSHFGDGRAFGVGIEYSITDEGDETGRRLWAARGALPGPILLVYGDVYWPLPLADLLAAHSAGGRRAQVTVYRNADRSTRNNVRVEEGLVIDYDSARERPGLNGVEIGYALLMPGALHLLRGENAPVGDVLLAPLASARQLGAYVTDHKYYGVGSPDRIARTVAFLTGSPAVILDRDGVLNRKPPRAEYVRNWDEFAWLPGAREALALLTRAGYRIVVVTNQPGIARGALTVDALEEIHRRMCAEAAAEGGRIDRIYACLHDWDEGCDCRKPRPGMLFRAQRELDLDLTATWMFGDDERDMEAARAAHCPARLVSAEVSLLDHVRSLVA